MPGLDGPVRNGEKRAEKAEAEVERLTADIADHWLPMEALADEVERLTAERQEVRRLAVEWAYQPTDYDDDTEAAIMCGRAILRAMGETLPPHWSDEDGA